MSGGSGFPAISLQVVFLAVNQVILKAECWEAEVWEWFVLSSLTKSGLNEDLVSYLYTCFSLCRGLHDAPNPGDQVESRRKWKVWSISSVRNVHMGEAAAHRAWSACPPCVPLPAPGTVGCPAGTAGGILWQILLGLQGEKAAGCQPGRTEAHCAAVAVQQSWITQHPAALWGYSQQKKKYIPFTSHGKGTLSGQHPSCIAGNFFRVIFGGKRERQPGCSCSQSWGRDPAWSLCKGSVPSQKLMGVRFSPPKLSFLLAGEYLLIFSATCFAKLCSNTLIIIWSWLTNVHSQPWAYGNFSEIVSSEERLLSD